MFNGWLSFAGTELLNEERTREYARHLMPTITVRARCGYETGLAAILGDDTYRTPLIDDAPWIDHDDPDTYGFCGAMPLSVSGLTDSTRTGTVIENTGDGGAVAGLRRGTKEVRVTALLMAQSEASLSAGKRWLTAALTGGCNPCEPDELCFLIGTPDDGSAAVGDYTTDNIPSKSLLGQASYWEPGSGVFRPTTTAQSVSTPEAPIPLPCDEITYTWRIGSATAGTKIVIETFGESGLITSDSFTLSATGGTYTVSDRGVSSRRSWSQLRVTSAPGEFVEVESVDMQYRLAAAEDACFTKYARQLRKVRCVYGPVTIEEFEPTSGAMERVEFSFVAESPYVYSLPVDVLSVTGTTITKNVGSDVYQLDKTVPACTVPTRPALVVDPDCPPVPLPPTLSVPTSSCSPDPAFRTSFALAIPDTLIPTWSDVVPILSISTNTVAARKVQVRWMPRPFPTQEPVDLDPCSTCGEFVIDYIPPNSTFTLNGMEERAYLEQPGGAVSEAGHLLSGLTSTSLFKWPVLTCGTAYLALVDVTTEGVGGFALSVAGRE